MLCEGAANSNNDVVCGLLCERLLTIVDRQSA